MDPFESHAKKLKDALTGEHTCFGDWSDEGRRYACRLQHGSELSRLPSRHHLGTLSIKQCDFIDFNPLFDNAKIFESWYKTQELPRVACEMAQQES